MIQRIQPDRAYPLHDAAATRRVEAAALAREALNALMQRTGAAVARMAQALAPHARRIWIACGPGDNGGDGLEAAVQLRHAGRPVCVTHWADPARLPADARAALARAHAAGVAFVPPPVPGSLSPHDLCIDALPGLGAAPRIPAGGARRTDALPPAGSRMRWAPWPRPVRRCWRSTCLPGCRATPALLL